MANTKEIIKIGQTEVRFLLEGSDTNKQMAMFEFSVPPGARVPLPHHHEHYDETVYCLAGVITFVINGEPKELHVGESLFIPRGAVHGFSNDGGTKFKALAVVTPAEIGPQFFRDSAEVVNNPGPDAMERMKIIFGKYGLVPAIPVV